jgi:hypothetical protein
MASIALDVGLLVIILDAGYRPGDLTATCTRYTIKSHDAAYFFYIDLPLFILSGSK